MPMGHWNSLVKNKLSNELKLVLKLGIYFHWHVFSMQRIIIESI